MYNFEDYQRDVMNTADFDDPFYPIASLMVESAELADLFVKPLLRGDPGEPERGSIVSEAGDVLWNLVAILDEYDITLEEVALYNIAKLKDRQERGVLRGNGNSR